MMSMSLLDGLPTTVALRPVQHSIADSIVPPPVGALDGHNRSLVLELIALALALVVQPPKSKDNTPGRRPTSCGSVESAFVATKTESGRLKYCIAWASLA